jgi:hypothetical protein
MRHSLPRFFYHPSLPYLFLIFLPVILFWKASLGTHLFAMGDLSGSDLLELHLPFKYILHDAYTHGQFPLWTPYLANGFPILAEGQSGPLYPVYIALAFIPPALSLNYSIIIALIIAGTGAYTFARRLPRMTVTGALASGVVFMLCSFFIARMKHLNMIAVAAYLPWGLHCVHKYCATFNFKWFVLLSLVISLQILAGHPQMMYFCVIMYAWQLMGEVGFLYWFTRSALTPSLFFFSVKVTLYFAISLCIAIGLSAIQLLPTYELTSLSSRQDFNYAVATDFPLNPKYLATFFAPFFLGNPAAGNYRGDLHTDGIWWENVLYIGLVPIFLVLVLFVFRFKRTVFLYTHRKALHVLQKKRSDLASQHIFSPDFFWYWFYFISFLIFFLLSLGNYSFLFSVLYYNIPGMSFFRFPTRFNLFTLFSLALMVGWATGSVVSRLEAQRVTAHSRKNASQDYVFSWPFSAFITKVLLIGFIVADLAVFSYQYISFYPVEKYLAVPQSVTDLAKDTSLYRIYPTTQYLQNPFSAMGWQKGEKAIYSLQAAVPGNFAARYHLYSFTDRAWFEGGLSVKDRTTLESLLTKNPLPAAAFSTLLSLWNVKYIIGYDALQNSEFTTFHTYALDKSFALPLTIYTNSRLMPRAYMAAEGSHSATLENTLTVLTADTFDPYRTVVLSDGSIPREYSGYAGDMASFKARNTVSIGSYDLTSVTMHAQSESGGYLVFSDTYYPGWNAYIDGKKSSILQANLVQRALWVEKGDHHIVWQYEPLSFYIGSGISLASWITLLSYLANHQRKKGSSPGREVAPT